VHEPLFGTLALYDVQSKKKISENFHFDTNADDISEMITKFFPTKEFASLSRQALFQVNYPNPEIYLVLKVDKVLEGDVNEAYDRFDNIPLFHVKLSTLAQFFFSFFSFSLVPFFYSDYWGLPATLDPPRSIS